MMVQPSRPEDVAALAELRVAAMKESLEAVGRFDPNRARERFLSGYNHEKTKKVLLEGELVGFYVLLDKTDHFYLDHLYIHPSFQCKQLGSQLMERIKAFAADAGLSIRLGALKESRSNDFYQSHGFVKTHEEAFDNYYELPSP